MTVRDALGSTTAPARSALDGYEVEWLALAELLAGGAPLEYDEQLEDTRFAVRLADAAAAHIESSAS